MSDTSGSPDRRVLLERAEKLWELFVKSDSRSLFEAGFTGWGTAKNTQVWASVAASRVHRLMRLVKDVKAVSPVPVAVGVGVSTPTHVRAIAKAGADGVIVAAALVEALGSDGRELAALTTLVRDLRAAT